MNIQIWCHLFTLFLFNDYKTLWFIIGVVPEQAHKVAQEKRVRAQLHADLAGRERGRRFGKRSGGRGIQQTTGPRHGRREDSPAAAQAPQSFFSAATGTPSSLTIL